MYHLRLTKGLSYHGVVSATKKSPDVYTDDEAVYAAAIASGYFEEAGDAPEKPFMAAPEKPAEQAKDAKPETEQKPEAVTGLSKMTVDELKQYASIKGIALDENMKKGAILKAIEEAEAKADKIRAGFRKES